MLKDQDIVNYLKENQEGGRRKISLYMTKNNIYTLAE